MVAAQLLTVKDIMTYLTSPVASGSDQYRYIAELASDELDQDGVPLDFIKADVVVAEPTQKTIEREIAACPWLEGYTLVSYWKPAADIYTPF